MIGLALFFASVYFYFNPAKRFISIFLLFALVTACFQILPLKLILVPGVTKPYDWVFLFFGIILILQPKHILNLQVWKRHLILLVFFLYLIFLFFYRGFSQNNPIKIATNNIKKITNIK